MQACAGRRDGGPKLGLAGTHTEQLTLGGGEPIFTWYEAEIHRKGSRMTLQAGFLVLATRWLIPKTAFYHRASVDRADKAIAALTT